MADADPPSPAPRVVQITSLHDAPCLHCGRRLKDTGTVLGSGRMRCDKCTELTYLIPLFSIQMAIIVNLTRQDIRVMQDGHMDVAAQIAYLGLAVPFVPVPILRDGGRAA